MVDLELQVLERVCIGLARQALGALKYNLRATLIHNLGEFYVY